MAYRRGRARICERTITAGNGPYTLAGPVDDSHNPFASFMAIGDTTKISVIEPGVAFWTGIGTYSATNQLTLTTVEETKGMFGNGTKEIVSGDLASSGALREDISGSIITAGTSSAYTVASYRGYDTLARMDGNLIGFTPHATNANAAGSDALLNVDGLGLKPVRSQSGVQLPTGALIAGTPYLALYRHADQTLYLHGMTNPYAIPLGGGMDYWGDTAPNSAFALAQGQTLSQSTYDRLFAIFGTKYNTGGEPVGTFRIPDKVGRASVMRDAGSARLSSAYFGGNPANLGATGGLERHTLVATQLPAGIPFSLTKPGQAVNSANPVYGGGVEIEVRNLSGTGVVVHHGQAETSFSAPAQSITGIVNPSGGDAHNIVQPSIVCNYIIRVL